MKNVKLRVPEGKAKEAHEYMRSLGYEYGLPEREEHNVTHLFGWSGGALLHRKDGDEDYFRDQEEEEIFLPGHELAPVKPKHKWDKEIRALLDGERVEMLVNETWLIVHIGGLQFFDDQYNKFRIAPRTMTINGMKFPEPMREEPEVGAEYYLSSAEFRIGYDRFRWTGTTTDLNWLKRGLIQSTEEGAIEQAKAMVAAVGGVW